MNSHIVLKNCRSILCFFLITSIFLGSKIFAREFPSESFEQLISEDFKVREQVQLKLTDWAREDPVHSRNLFYRLWKNAKDPEQAERCLGVLRELLFDEYLSVGEGFLGIQMGEEQVKLPNDPIPRRGIRVINLLPNEAADKSGVQQRDLIIGIDDVIWHEGPIFMLFMDKIKALKPKSKVTLHILRGDKIIEIIAILGRRPILGALTQEQMQAAEKQSKEAYFQQWLKSRKAAQTE